MFSISFSISNPFSRRWISVYNRVLQLSKHKFMEIELMRDSGIISGSVRITARQSHAGVYISAGLLGWDIGIDLYDHRHWDRENNCWEKSTE